MAKTKEELVEIGKTTQFKSGKQAAENGRKGGLANGKAAKERKIIREEILKTMNETDWQEMIAGIIARAKDSDKAFELLRDTIGQKPVTETLITTDADDFEFKFKYSK